MAKKISDLTDKPTLAGTEQLEINDAGTSKRATASAIATLSGVQWKALTFTSDTDSTADSDPGAGLFKWNNATQASATVLYIDDSTADSVSLATFWSGLPASGYLYIQQADDSTRWQVWKWSAVADGTGYHKLTAAIQGASASAIQDAKTCYLAFAPGSAASGGTELKGLQFTSTTGSTADSDPGNGVFKWNNATQSSATTLYFDNQTTDGISLTTYWAGLAATGYVYIVQGDDSTRWQLWKWSAVTDGTGYRKLTVTLQAASASAIQDAKTCYCDFDSDGSTGGSGTTGRHLIAVSAGSMVPSVSGGCAALAAVATSANHPDLLTLDFDATTAEYEQFAIPMPKSWNEGTITAKFVWSHAATTVNFGVVWKLEAVAVSDGDTIDVAYGTGQQAADTGGTTSTQYVSPETSAITVGGSPAAEDVVYFRVSRVPTDVSDTMAIDARLHQVLIYIVTDAENDA